MVHARTMGVCGLIVVRSEPGPVVDGRSYLRFWDPVVDRWVLSHEEERVGSSGCRSSC